MSVKRLSDRVRTGDLANILSLPVGTQTLATAKRGRRLTGSVIDDIVHDYPKGISAYALTTKYGAHRSVIATHLESQGVEFRPTAFSSKVSRALELHR